MSIAEAQLVIAHHARQYAAEVVAAVRGAYLANGAAWSDAVAADLTKFVNDWLAIAEDAPPKQATVADLRGIFALAGIPGGN